MVRGERAAQEERERKQCGERKYECHSYCVWVAIRWDGTSGQPCARGGGVWWMKKDGERITR